MLLQATLYQAFCKSVLHREDGVDTLNRDGCLDHRRSQQASPEGNLFVVSLKKSERQRYNRYELKCYLLSTTAIDSIASSPSMLSKTAKLSASLSSIAPKTVCTPSRCGVATKVIKN